MIELTQELINELLDDAMANDYNLDGWTAEEIACDLLAYADLPEGTTEEMLIPLVKVWQEQCALNSKK